MMYDVWADRNREMRLVGRARELRTLTHAVGGATPRGAAVVLSGDAGVGKSRLIGEFLDQRVAAGWRVLVGHCLDFGDTAMPYLPFTEMLRRLDTQEPELTKELAAAHPVLAQLSRTQRGVGQIPTDGLDRADVLASMHACFEDLATRGPVVVVVEDVHWADPSSRDLISYLLARGFTGSVALVISYRSDDLHRKHPLRRNLAEWSRMPQVERLVLDPLVAADARRLVGEIVRDADRPPSQHDLAEIVTRAAGNPFYVEELAGVVLGGDGRLPEDFADILLVRLDRLDQNARTLVRETSVGGQRVPHDLLAMVSVLAAGELDDALRVAIDSSVLVRAGEDAYAFRHALLGEAVYDDLLPGERLRLHTAYAGAIRERGKPAPAALARHAQASHDYATALVASIEAGERAMTVGGPEEAARHFETALDLYDRGARDLEPAPDRAALVVSASNALAASGHPLRALGLVSESLAALPAETPSKTRALLLLAKARAAFYTESDVSLTDVTDEGLALVGEGPSELRARLLSMRAWGHILQDDFAAARADVDEALDLASRLSLVDLAAEVRITLSRLNFYADLDEEARAVLTESLAEARSRFDVEGELAALYRLGSLHYEFAEHDLALQRWDEAIRLARRHGRQWAPYGFDARLMAAIDRYTVGDWDGALATVDTAAEAAPQTLRAMLTAVELLVAAGRGETDALSRMPAVRERWRRDGLIALLSGAASIDLAGTRDGGVAAVAAYDEVVEVLSVAWEPTFQARVRLAGLTLDHLIDAIAAAPESGRAPLRAEAERLHDDAAGVMTVLAERGRRFGPEGTAWWLRVLAGHAHVAWRCGDQSDVDELVAGWDRAVDAFTVFAQPAEIARAQVRRAEVLRAAGRNDAAAADLAAAHGVANKLGARPILDAVERLTPERSTTSPTAVALTRREHEILLLVAEGRSNGQIAGQLFISTKTVSVHVSNILAKLGASRRTEAAAIARRDGLI